MNRSYNALVFGKVFLSYFAFSVKLQLKLLIIFIRWVVFFLFTFEYLSLSSNSTSLYVFFCGMRHLCFIFALLLSFNLCYNIFPFFSFRSFYSLTLDFIFVIFSVFLYFVPFSFCLQFGLLHTFLAVWSISNRWFILFCSNHSNESMVYTYSLKY